jgi:hypothetical protein
MRETAYVYKWVHLPTLMWYVGSRTAQGCHPNDGYICSSQIMPSIIKNPKEWHREIIDIGSKKDMFDLETEILQTMDAMNDPQSFNGHNNNFPLCNNKGKKRTDAVKKQMSIDRKGRKISDATKQKISVALSGKPKSIEHKIKTSESGKGRKMPTQSKEHIEKRVAAHKGKKQSEETRAKIAAAAKGRKASAETRAKMSATRKGKKRQLEILL